jgi:gliding motility-associated-like protein
MNLCSILKYQIKVFTSVSLLVVSLMMNIPRAKAQSEPADAAFLMNWFEFDAIGNKQFKTTFVTSLFKGYSFDQSQTLMVYVSSGNVKDSFPIAIERTNKIYYACDAIASNCKGSNCLEWEQYYFSGIANFNQLASGLFLQNNNCNLTFSISPKIEEFQRFFGAPSDGMNLYYELGKPVYASGQLNICFDWKVNDISPKFIRPPNHLEFRVGQNNHYSMSANINEGDSLDYSFICAASNTNECAKYKSHYTPSYPIETFCRGIAPPCAPSPNTNPPRGFYIHPTTGDLSFRAESGNHSRMAVKVKQFRRDTLGNFQLAGFIVWESYIYSTYAALNNHPELSLIRTFSHCEGTPFLLNRHKYPEWRPYVFDQTFSDSLIYDYVDFKVHSEINGLRTYETRYYPFGQKVNIEWDVPFGAARSNPYLIHIFADDQDCALPAVAAKTMSIKVIDAPELFIEYDTGKCGHLIFEVTNLKPEQTVAFEWRWFKKGDSIPFYVTSEFKDSFLVTDYDTFELQFWSKNLANNCERIYLDTVPFNGLPAFALNIKNAPDTSFCFNNLSELEALLRFPRGPVVFDWTWNDSLLSFKSNPYIFEALKDANVIVEGTDSLGCYAVDTINVTIIENNIKPDLGDDFNLCPKEEAELKIENPSQWKDIVWFPDSIQSETLTVQDSGIYIVKATFNTSGCYGKDTILIGKVPFEKILPDTFTFATCPGDSVLLTGILPPSATNPIWEWFNLNNNNSIGSTQNVQYLPPSSHSISLKLTWDYQDKTCDYTDTTSIVLYPEPEAMFSMSDSAVCYGNNINLTNQSQPSNEILTLNWIVNEQSLSNSDSYTIQKYSPGVYKVVLKVSNEYGCKDSALKQFKINELPKTILTTSNTVACKNDGSLTFSLDYENNSSTFQVFEVWFPGNTNSTQFYSPVTTQILFSDTGKLNMRVITKSQEGCADTLDKEFIVYPEPLIGIEINATCSNEQAIVKIKNPNNEAVRWETSLMTQNKGGVNLQSLDSTIINYDVIVASGNVVHYTKYTNSYGCSEERADTVPILPAPSANFEWLKLVNSEYFDFLFTSTGTGIRNWYWEAEPDDTFSGQKWEHRFADSGMYWVKLRVEGNNGCFNEKDSLIPVYKKIYLFIPNAFSPNGDGLNETFKPVGVYKYIKEYRMEIYHRWGGKVFETTNIHHGWDGGSYLSSAYLYRIYAMDVFGNKEYYKGTLHLMR